MSELFGAGALIYSRETKRFLFNQRGEGEHAPFTWATWGGLGDPGESAYSCMIREVEEESGFRADLHVNVEVLSFPPYVEGNGFIFHNFLIVVDSEFTPTISDESAGFCWAGIDDLPMPIHPSVIEFITLNRAALVSL